MKKCVHHASLPDDKSGQLIDVDLMHPPVNYQLARYPERKLRSRLAGANRNYSAVANSWTADFVSRTPSEILFLFFRRWRQ
ncbi:MAG: hypothetical protein WBE88_10230, partial [Candidatus Acidiferrales bacterium]